MIHITRKIYNELVEWTKEEKPNEAAGYLFKDNTIFCRIITRDKSPTHFFDRSPEYLVSLIERYGSPSAIFHSHPGPAIPSGMDVPFMEITIPLFNCYWLIMSNNMRLRAWGYIDCGIIREEEVEIIE